MPLYAYSCQSCGKETEQIQKFSDPPLKKCPSCGGRLKRLISATAFQLKGGGWYKDGYASSPPSKKEAATTDQKSTKDPQGSKEISPPKTPPKGTEKKD